MRLLTLTFVLLVVIVVAETILGQPDSHPRGMTPQRSEIQTGTQTRPADRPETSRDLAINVVLARPLFSPDRKPVGRGTEAVAGLPRLAGIISSPGQAVAIFQPADTSRSLAVSSGQTVGGWEVTAVSQESVILSKANERIVLRPTFATSDARPETAIAAIPAPPRAGRTGQPLISRLDGLDERRNVARQR